MEKTCDLTSVADFHQNIKRIMVYIANNELLMTAFQNHSRERFLQILSDPKEHITSYCSFTFGLDAQAQGLVVDFAALNPSKCFDKATGDLYNTYTGIKLGCFWQKWSESDSSLSRACQTLNLWFQITQTLLTMTQVLKECFESPCKTFAYSKQEYQNLLVQQALKEDKVKKSLVQIAKSVTK